MPWQKKARLGLLKSKLGPITTNVPIKKLFLFCRNKFFPIRIICPSNPVGTEKYSLFHFRLTKYQHLFFVQLLAQILAPIALVLTLVCNIVRFYQTGPSTDYNHDKIAMDWLEILVLNPITSALPVVSLSFPLYWIVANYIALAKIMNDYLSFRHVHVTDDPFDDTPGFAFKNWKIFRP